MTVLEDRLAEFGDVATQGDTLLADCPLCSDTLGVIGNPEQDAWICFTCGTEGNAEDLAKMR